MSFLRAERLSRIWLWTHSQNTTDAVDAAAEIGIALLAGIGAAIAPLIAPDLRLHGRRDDAGLHDRTVPAHQCAGAALAGLAAAPCSRAGGPRRTLVVRRACRDAS